MEALQKQTYGEDGKSVHCEVDTRLIAEWNFHTFGPPLEIHLLKLIDALERTE